MSNITDKEILDGIVEIFSNNENMPGAAGIEITMETSLKDDLGVDSLKLVQIMIAIEDKYNIVFEVEDLDPRMFEFVSDLVTVTGKTISKGDQT